MSARLMDDGASECFFSQSHFQPTNIYNHQEHINMTVNYSNDKGEEKKQEEVETPEPGTPWVEGKEEDAGAMIERIILIELDTVMQNGGIQAVQEMLADGNQVKLVSSPDKDNYAESSEIKTKWVAENLGADWLPRLVLTPDKTLVQGHVLIDDKPSCKEGAITPNWRHIVYSTSDNQELEGPRIDSWSEWRAAMPCKIPLSIANKETLDPNGINFSCVFPSFNQYEIVRKTLAGLAKQKVVSDFKFECIIVDNNSTDDIQQIYMDYRDKLDLRLIQRRKLENTFSVPSARNMGILEAKYDYIGT
jgi:5'(3')-deoxyribonucleotidase